MAVLPISAESPNSHNGNPLDPKKQRIKYKNEGNRSGQTKHGHFCVDRWAQIR